MSASLGATCSVPIAPTMNSSASTQAGTSIVTPPSAPKTPQPFWAAVLSHSQNWTGLYMAQTPSSSLVSSLAAAGSSSHLQSPVGYETPAVSKWSLL